MEIDSISTTRVRFKKLILPTSYENSVLFARDEDIPNLVLISGAVLGLVFFTRDTFRFKVEQVAYNLDKRVIELWQTERISDEELSIVTLSHLERGWSVCRNG